MLTASRIAVAELTHITTEAERDKHRKNVPRFRLQPVRVFSQQKQLNDITFHGGRVQSATHAGAEPCPR